MKTVLVRRVLIASTAITALAFSGPLWAKDAPEQRVLGQLNDPAFQDRMAGMLAGFMRAMLTLPVGDIAESVKQAIPPDMRDPDEERSARDTDRNATLGDMIARDNPDFVDDIEGQTRDMTRMMGGMAGNLAGMLPELRAMGERMKRQMEGSLPKD